MNMPILPQFGNSEQSMTSLEIAELCQKRHDNVKRLIDNLTNQQVIACPQVEVVQKEANNRIYDVEVCVFTGEQGKLDSITVVAQLSPEFTAALVKRWYELENAQAKLPQSFAEALQLAADQARQLELAAPKVKHYDAVVERHTLLNASQVAQKIGLSAVKMNRELDALDVYNKSIKRARVSRLKHCNVVKLIMQALKNLRSQSQLLFRKYLKMRII